MRRRVAILLVICFWAGAAFAAEGSTDNTPDWFFPEWAARAPNNRPIRVLDTDSPLGRYSLKTKEIGLKDLARMHGHLCDGLVMAFLGIRYALEHLFPQGVVDRTDLRVVTRNSPCFVDAATLMTGARINFMTVRMDNSLKREWIVQRISTGETYHVRLRPGVFPPNLARLEKKIKEMRKKGLPVSAELIDRYEAAMWAYNRKLLYTPVQELFEIKKAPPLQIPFSGSLWPPGRHNQQEHAPE
ncbi:hypothetical protein FVE67_06825 [Thermosulfurimonas marina]|uniref:Formylmethanofuran dehydrogenase subunit E domain-containing protein n=1 Tax=Thermosulfurimonas marina TaxID=2047767 RepID=A0A6H1WTH3_9BACT|nr:FmdE family protein [Thermosulfurimonas marina]QJA06525.1 hypothetical protein FVE67_06825 [Thermosulfurimonas marina]